MRSLFIAYNDECDSSRANHVRKRLLATGNFLVEGYCPFTTWSKTKGGSSLTELKEQFDQQLQSCAAVLVLIGEDSAANPWIRYAIEQAYTRAKPLLAIDISSIPDEYGDIHPVDINPLERFAVVEQGEKIYLNERYETFDWCDDIDDHIEAWIEAAAINAEQTERMRVQESTARQSNYRDYEAMRTDRGAALKAVHA